MRRRHSPNSDPPPRSAHIHPAGSSDERLAKLEHLRQLSHLWDNYLGIPGTRFRVGLESIIGLLPFGGDAIGVVLSSYIIFRALQLGIPRNLLAKMIFNVVLDGAVGTVPILGDLFDTTWKANTRNVQLLEAHLQTPDSGRRVNRWLVIAIFVGVLLVLAVLVTLGILVIRWIWQVLGG